jgi:hypothetical protein
MSTAIVQGSLHQISQQSGKSIAETFINARVIVIVDTSGSMNTTDSRGGRSRYDVACEELKALQGQYPGEVAVISFSDQVSFCPSGIPIFYQGGTDLENALKFCKIGDVAGMQFIVISDGQPDDDEAALAIARTYQNRIDTIYTGPESSIGGREFLRRLADASGGRFEIAGCANELAGKVSQLMLTAL